MGGADGDADLNDPGSETLRTCSKKQRSRRHDHQKDEEIGTEDEIEFIPPYKRKP